MPPEDHKHNWQDIPMKVYLDNKEIRVTASDVTMTISMEANFQGKRRRMKERALKLLWRHMRHNFTGTGVLKLRGSVNEN